MEIGVDVDEKKEGTFIKDQNYFWAQSNDDLLEFLKEDLKNSRWDKAIIEGVPEDKVLILQNWIKKNKGKIEGIEVSIKPTLTGLTVEEEETFEMKYRAELDCNRVQLCLEEIEKFQRYNEPNCPEEWKPLRLGEKLKWWEQKLKKAKAQDMSNALRLKRAIKTTRENIKTTKKYIRSSLRLQNATTEKEGIYKKLEEAQPKIEAHDKRGKGPRMDKDPLNLSIGEFDKYMISQTDEDLSTSEVALQFELYVKSNFKEYKHFIIEVRNEDDNLEYWKTVRGDRKKMTASWDYMYRRFYRARNNRKKEAKRKK